MEQIIRHTLLIIALSLCACALPQAATAQTRPDDKAMSAPPPAPREDGHRPNFSPEQFRRDITAYITRCAGLTESEARDWLPVYFEMKQKMRALEHQKGRALHRAAQRNMNEKDCARILHESIELDKKMQRIEEQYLKRLEKKLSAKKLLKIKAAEQTFGREAFKRMVKK